MMPSYHRFKLPCAENCLLLISPASRLALLQQVDMLLRPSRLDVRRANATAAVGERSHHIRLVALQFLDRRRGAQALALKRSTRVVHDVRWQGHVRHTQIACMDTSAVGRPWASTMGICR